MEKLLRESKVIKGGAISVYGTIRILAEDAEADIVKEEGDPYGGLVCFSSKLLKYRDGKYKARIKGITVEVSKGEEIVETISYKYFFAVDNEMKSEGWRGTVSEEGYVMTDIRPQSSIDSDLRALRQAEKEERPESLDNSDYIKVSPKHKGKKVMKLKLQKKSGLSIYHVFDLEGNILGHRITRPLSYKRWAPDNPSARYARK